MEKTIQILILTGCFMLITSEVSTNFTAISSRNLQSPEYSGWCCAIEQPIKSKQRTRIGVVVNGHNVFYHIATYDVTDPDPCYDKSVRCCRNFFHSNQKKEEYQSCLGISEVANIPQNVKLAMANPEFMEILANIDSKLLPTGLIKKHDLRVKESGLSGWCCANEQPVKSIQRTRTAATTFTSVRYNRIITGYRKCGFLNLKRCTVWGTQTIYSQQIEYYTDYYDVPVKDACPDRFVRCCKNMVYIGPANKKLGSCYTLSEVSEHFDIILNILG